ncbi:beta-ketoacyl synthase domain-containing protein [Seiridium cupressi]
MAKTRHHQQEPVAIIGFACRLPGGNNTPQKLWDFLERGDIASHTVPETRFSFAGHFDGSLKPKTLRQAGGMFLGDIDPADFDAGFFEVGGAEAIAMDPNQRQMFEVVFEGLENAGIPLEKLDNQPVGCFVGSYAADYADMQNRDPEDRPANNALGVGRAILANRLSHFPNVKGPSVTLDTACSGSLQGLDLACRYLQSGDINAAIVATSNLYMSPEHLIDTGSIGSAHSPTALCHTFDVAADGYVKAEAVSTIIVKRLEDAIRDRDPIRAVVLGTASNNNGRTAGIASPSAEAQSMAIRAAYAHAGITDLSQTTYIECHGTGTQAGDPTEVRGIGSVFAATRAADNPLIIGSVKSNIGHSEPAAGISGLLKAILSIENGFLPGNPTFINPSPKIDFASNKVKAFRHGIPWPENAPKRASINSFGYGGSNAHAIIEQPRADDQSHHISSFVSAEDDFVTINEDAPRPSVLVLSANDSGSLQAGIKSLADHLINPRVKVGLSDLAFTLSERRTRLWHRAFTTTHNTELDETTATWTTTKKSPQAPRFGFVFTGQGAQWPQMGRQLVQFFPWTRKILEELDDVLKNLRQPPTWSLLSELTEPRTPEHLRQPEFSQPLVTALQLCIIAVLETWGVKPDNVVGNSSGEIAAAYAAGHLDRAGAITAACYRGRAALNHRHEAEQDVGMLAVGLGAETATEFLNEHVDEAWIACFNSPSSVTISGKVPAIESLRQQITAAGHFARRLQVDLAYHSELMNAIGEEYELLLSQETSFCPSDNIKDGHASLFSSVSQSKRDTPTDAAYWKANMVSAVRFDGAMKSMLEGTDAPNILIEIGPSGALAGPISQILKSLPTAIGGDITYLSSWARGDNSGKSLFDVAGRLWALGAPINLAVVNEYSGQERTIVDLPNYNWNHSVKYWHENAASKDWRFRKYIVHDLLGSKILGSSWHAPTWRSRLNVANVPWLMDHRMGGDAIMPGAGFITMALEALYQKHSALIQPEEIVPRNDMCYRFRNVRFSRALVLEEGKDVIITFSLTAVPGDKHWHEFRISTTEGDVQSEHCSGLVRTQDPIDDPVRGADALPLMSPQAPKLWYKCQREIGMEFSPAFQKLIEVEAVTGHRECRTLISLEPSEGKYNPQSYYPIHPAALDGCLQTVVPSNDSCDRTNVKSVMIPALIDDFVINKVPTMLRRGRSKATSVYGGRGRLETEKSWVANTTVYNAETGQLIMQITGLNYTKLDVAPKTGPHTFHCVTWKPDIAFLNQDQATYLSPERESSKLDMIVDLVAYKKPTLKVLEIYLGGAGSTSLWFNAGDVSVRAAYARYDFGSPDAKVLVNMETQLKDKGNAEFHSIAKDDVVHGLPSDITYDLIILGASTKAATTNIHESLDKLKAFLVNGSFMLLVRTHSTEYLDDAEEESSDVFDTRPTTPLEGPDPVSRSSPSIIGSANSSISSTVSDEETFKRVDGAAVPAKIAPPSLISVVEIFGTGQDPQAFLFKLSDNKDPVIAAASSTARHLAVLHLSKDAPRSLAPSLQSSLESSGWTITHHTDYSPKATRGAVVLVLDELSNAVLAHANESQWSAIKSVISCGGPLLWVTKGAQGSVTEPNNALVHGLFRVARQEDSSVKLTTLDVQSSTNPATSSVIAQVLGLLTSGANFETEYMERDGILHVQRIIPDTILNDFRRAEVDGIEPVLKGFTSLMWCETESGDAPVLNDGQIEVEVMAVGVNFKDVAITMGIVPDDEYNIGFECAGVVRRMAPGTHKFNVGDRVCMLKAGSYANRVKVSVDRCHVIPDAMTFEEAATIPSVYLCSLYVMYHLGNFKEGQSILIHSATGGVGIACIELAQHKKAEIYVTVGTEEKRDFLEKNYGIPRHRMFSSRNTSFAKSIIQATSGRGVDVVINSLVGELLDASWRIMADGGNMVEIGKRDIVDRNTFSMEPFDRNCSFRAVDMSYTRDIKDSLVARLFDELFVLIDGGHIKPIQPITTFGFDNVVGALTHIRSGRHLGKTVISHEGKSEDVNLRIRPAVREVRLSPDVSYLIVGGLKGACGTLAIHLAQHGARHIVVNSRSGICDDASARIVASCAFYGCQVKEVQSDVGNFEGVAQLFRTARPRIAGIIQGAMVLRDKPFEMMTLDDYHNAIHAKVQGTWNLHCAAQDMKRHPLEFFTMLSSTSGIVGNKGQANYAAANTFLNAFASYRRGLGLRANTVDLGLIEDVGFVAEQDSGLEILTYSILQQQDAINADSSAEMITGVGFPLPRDDSAGLSAEPRFAYLFNSRGGNRGAGLGEDDADDSGGQVDQLIKQFRLMHKANADVNALHQTCVELVALRFVKLLRLEVDPEPGRPLVAYGLDSLSAVELRNWIRSKLGVELTTLDITNASSLIALCEKVVSKIAQP